jgi:hypothetical protein
MTTTMTARLEVGKDIILQKGERLVTYKNKITGEYVYSTSLYTSVYREGKEFIPVFKVTIKPLEIKNRRVNLIAADAIERVKI